MAVVINEFEVVPAEPPPPRPAGAGAAADGGAPQPPDEHELRRIARQQHERQERVRAY